MVSWSCGLGACGEAAHGGEYLVQQSCYLIAGIKKEEETGVPQSPSRAKSSNRKTSYEDLPGFLLLFSF
jgi:hypothetical protein